MCHSLWWWVMWCWWRVTYCLISKWFWSKHRRRCMYQMYWKCVIICSHRQWMRCCILWFSTPLQHLFYCMNIGQIVYLSNYCWIIRNQLILVGMIWIDVNRVGIFVIPNCKICATKIFNFKSIFELSIIKNVVASKFFTFNFHRAMPRQAPIGEIRNPSIEEDKSPDISWWYFVITIPPNIAILPDSSTTLQTGNQWSYASNGFKWFYGNSFIPVPPEISTYFITTFNTPEVEVLINVSPSINRSACLVSMYDDIVVPPRTTYHDIFRPYGYFQQLEMSHPTMVGVC